MAKRQLHFVATATTMERCEWSTKPSGTADAAATVTPPAPAPAPAASVFRFQRLPRKQFGIQW